MVLYIATIVNGRTLSASRFPLNTRYTICSLNFFPAITSKCFVFSSPCLQEYTCAHATTKLNRYQLTDYRIILASEVLYLRRIMYSCNATIKRQPTSNDVRHPKHALLKACPMPPSALQVSNRRA